jgi:hypothetical protein
MTLREECRLRVLENIVLTRIFRPRRKVTGGWKIFYEEFHNLNTSPGIIRLLKQKRM